MPIRSLAAILLAALALDAQTPGEGIAPGRQIDLQALSTAVRTMRRNSSAGEQFTGPADKLIAESGPYQASGQTGEARRRLANAFALLNQQTWDQKLEFAWSLALRTDAAVADSSQPFIGRLTQVYPAPYKPVNGLKLRVSVVRPGADGKPVRQGGAFEVPSRDLIDQPFGFDTDLDGVADGGYLLRAELLDGEAPVATVETLFQVVQGLQARRASVEKRLARIQGHDSAKATVRCPFELARAVNIGRRQMNANDFGLPFRPQPVPYDFVKGIQSSIDLLTSLESGKDPLWRAKGDHSRHYWFEEAHEMMPYRVYVPLKWDGRSKLPMILVLHGNTRGENYYFDRDDHILSTLAERHGYLVVCPLGYRPNAGWGSSALMRRLREGELSEKDALNVLALVVKEYPIDSSRTFLFGHSAGGGGTWYLGQKYADRWAAIAASAAPTRPDGFPFERLKGVPVMVCHGDQDDQVPVANSRNMVKAAKENGLDPRYLEISGATHITIVALAEPKVFEFFDQHGRK
jgi:predicted esterase